MALKEFIMAQKKDAPEQTDDGKPGPVKPLPPLPMTSDYVKQIEEEKRKGSNK